MTKRFAFAVLILTAMFAWAQTAQAAACRAADTYAASFWGTWMGSGGSLGSDGNPTVVQYANSLANVGGAFDGIEFTAPCKGTYSFTVSFVRDNVSTTTTCGTVPGTYDDVYIQFWKHPADGSGDTVVGAGNGAWAPIIATDALRGTGTYTMALVLDPDDAIYTKVLSDGGKFRCLAEASFTGIKVGDAN